MPTYAYACTDCGHHFEIKQSFSEDSLTVCPTCEGRLRKLFNAVGVVFKGSGFYRTDSRTSGKGSSSSSAGSSSSTGSSSAGSSSAGSSGSSGAKVPAGASAGSGASSSGSSGTSSSSSAKGSSSPA